jgi:subtilisin-like proprotein convertase family protein
MNKQKSAACFRSPEVFFLSFAALSAIVFSVLLMRSAPVKAQEEISPSLIVFSENFDGVTAPALPAGWTTTASGDIETFRTVSTFPDSAPNAAFVHDPNTDGVSELVSPSIALGNIQHKIIFRHFYQTDFEFDGGVLEISIGGGGFQDIITAGGTFVTGGYDTPLLGSALGGRRAWTGQQSGYITTEINLPANTANQSVRFRWRMATDPMEAGDGWRIDNVQVTNAISGTNLNAISIPTSGTASPYPSEINVSNHFGFVTGVQVSLTNFSHNSPDDVDLILVAPDGKKVVLMSDVGGASAVNNLNLFFTDAATASLPDNSLITSGNFKPTNFEPNDTFPAPVPVGAPTGALLSAFNGSMANGAWQLFLVDDNGNNAGSINGGWTLFVQSSLDAISIPEVGTAQPYASEKTITGLLGTITKATVTLTNFSHTSPDDVDIMLVAPNGKRIVLMSDVGGTTEVGGLNFTFDDNAASSLPDNSALASGTFKPTNFEAGDAFPAPAPQGALTGTTLNAFFGSAPNGLWKLFIVDDNGSNLGSVAGSWSISLQTSTTACAFTLSPIAQAFPVAGGSGNFGINMPSGCFWSASTNSSFVTINSALNGTGGGAINFSVAANMSGAREGFIDVTNGVVTRTFQVQQPSGCPVSLSQSTLNFGAAGGAGNVSVTAGAVCSWQATTNANWIQITSAQQSGDGQATFTVSPNTSGNLRSAIVTIGAQTVSVSQAAAGARRFDFDGDGKSDVSIYRPSSGVWYLLNSAQQGSYSAVGFGLATDKIAPADFDGDRKFDVAVFRPSEGNWYIFQSQTNTVRIEAWGLAEDIPVPADFDGDGRADLTVRRLSNATWYIRRSVDNVYTSFANGLSTDTPVSGDFDGDGKTDFALYRAGATAGSPSSWVISNSGNGQTTLQQFGNNGDVAFAADFDGDGRDNMTVFRSSNGTWYTSTDPSTNYGARQWGVAGDIPAPGDYNGDGRADFAVFRQGIWYIQHSNDSTTRTEFWGLDSDKVVPSAFSAQ